MDFGAGIHKKILINLTGKLRVLTRLLELTRGRNSVHYKNAE